MFYITLTIEEDGGEESPLNIHTVDSDIESSTYSQVSIYIYTQSIVILNPLHTVRSG